MLGASAILQSVSMRGPGVEPVSTFAIVIPVKLYNNDTGSFKIVRFKA